jgi:hypothetical protein
LLETLGGRGSGEEGGAVRYSADLLAVASPSFLHPVYQPLTYPAQVLGLEPFEGAAYVGIVPAVLVLLAAWRVRGTRIWLLLGAVAWLLSLGPLLRVGGEVVGVRAQGIPTGVTLPYALLTELPFLSIVRTPGRFNFLVAFVVALVAGLGAAYVAERLAGRSRIAWGAAVIVCAIIVLDYQFWWRDGVPAFPLIPAAIPEPITALREREDVRAVFHVPWQQLIAAKDALWLQTGYVQPMIAGHVTRRTPLDPARGWLLQTFDPALLNEAGVDVIILHRAWADADLEAVARARLGQPFYEDSALIAWDAPAVTSSASSVQLVPPLDTPLTDAPVYLFLPHGARVRVRADVVSDALELQMLVQSGTAAAWMPSPTLRLDAVLQLEAGFHTIQFVTAPLCVRSLDPTLVCRTFEFEMFNLDVETIP